MKLEPNSITKEDIKISFKEAFAFMRIHISIYLILWLLMMLNVYLSVIEPYWLIISPLFFAIGFVTVFELTCTLFVGYKGSIYNKLAISAKAGAKTLITLVSNHPLVVGIYIFLFYSVILRVGLGIFESSSNPMWAFKSASWVGIMMTGFYNISTVVRMGCIAMFMSTLGNYKDVDIIVKKAKNKNIIVYLHASFIGFVIMCLMVVLRDYFSIAILFYCIVSGFFLFQKIFEPPKLKKLQEKEVENLNVIPELT